jgi:hypothetical protein
MGDGRCEANQQHDQLQRRLAGSREELIGRREGVLIIGASRHQQDGSSEEHVKAFLGGYPSAEGTTTLQARIEEIPN